MAVQYLEQFDQGERRLGLTVLVAREGIHTPPQKKWSSARPCTRRAYRGCRGSVQRLHSSGISWSQLLERNNQNVIDHRQLEVDLIAAKGFGVVHVLQMEI